MLKSNKTFGEKQKMHKKIKVKNNVVLHLNWKYQYELIVFIFVKLKKLLIEL